MKAYIYFINAKPLPDHVYKPREILSHVAPFNPQHVTVCIFKTLEDAKKFNGDFSRSRNISLHSFDDAIKVSPEKRVILEVNLYRTNLPYHMEMTVLNLLISNHGIKEILALHYADRYYDIKDEVKKLEKFYKYPSQLKELALHFAKDSLNEKIGRKISNQIFAILAQFESLEKNNIPYFELNKSFQIIIDYLEKTSDANAREAYLKLAQSYQTSVNYNWKKLGKETLIVGMGTHAILIFIWAIGGGISLGIFPVVVPFLIGAAIEGGRLYFKYQQEKSLYKKLDSLIQKQGFFSAPKYSDKPATILIGDSILTSTTGQL